MAPSDQLLSVSPLAKVLKRKNLLSIYFTAGYPDLESIKTILKTLQESAVDLVEVGFPFSDPIADGPVIQNSSYKALQNGLTLSLLLERLKQLRNEVEIPILLMGYLNPVFRFGVEKFCEECSMSGISGVIIPDLTPEVYQKEYAEVFNHYNLPVIFLITPETPEERIRLIDALSTAFIYVVSASATTGSKLQFSQDQVRYLERISRMNLQHPVLTGFGISNRETFELVCNYSQGGIIGSSFIHELSNAKNPEETIKNFVRKIRKG